MSVTHWVSEILKLTSDKSSVYLSSYAGGLNTSTFTDSYFFFN